GFPWRFRYYASLLGNGKTTQLASSMERGFRGLEAFHDKQTIVHRVISMDGKVGATGIGLDGRRTPSGSYETSSCPR
ncbi:hypothetical protein U6J68_12605, partial [Cutibacterium acnes]